MHEIGTINRHQRLRSMISLIVMLAILVVVVAFFSSQLEAVSDFIRRAGWMGWLVSILVFALFGATPVPSEPVTILITTIFGPLSAAIITSLGNLLAALVEFYIGDKMSCMADFAKLRERLPFGLSRVPVDSPLFLIAGRMLPGYGPKFVSICSGIYRVPFLRYLWTTAVATTVGAVIVAFGGYDILSLFVHK
jgi:uncharacterized membrane protein YdjX (TVP38/TMEM64 family)